MVLLIIMWEKEKFGKVNGNCKFLYISHNSSFPIQTRVNKGKLKDDREMVGGGGD